MCNFPINPPVRWSVDQLVGQFPLRTESYTSMLLSETLIHLCIKFPLPPHPSYPARLHNNTKHHMTKIASFSNYVNINNFFQTKTEGLSVWAKNAK